ncbi:glycine--tRNA ligase, partial [Candidatus Parcubacteria bacterium]|nr:glycine--tRNA ligase [Candidatus Parcubacteria bacterium]
LDIRETGAVGKELIETLSRVLKGKKCPECGGELTKPRCFNLLVEAGLGVIEGEKQKVYLRGEACQTIYLNYQNVLDSTSLKIPFGIAQIGKAFRNEITPKNFLYRQREFEQWDLQWFVNPKEMEKWYEYWKGERMQWYRGLVNHEDKVRFRQHDPDELAHYAKVAFDIEYETPFGWKEWEGIHWRGDWDLSRHGQFSGKDFTYRNPRTKEEFLPWIVETSGGVDRTFLFLLLDAYHEVDGRVVLKLRPDLAPYKVAVFPLVANKEKLVARAREVYEMLRCSGGVETEHAPSLQLPTVWDDRGNIGKRYYAQDEIGTPWCVTIDYQTLEDNTVTIRDRDTMKQERIKISALCDHFQSQLNSS